ncbi:chemotaxis protein CheW [Nodosilinea nodulosa]|uniref:chemotaxis protein CheW n=1 Tax=Nodosilinea nodulosa TaxID=416001 RepID=UPI0002DED397|nr:chemotaxis protein CheW [Nodosilinea nodulosa]
MSPTSYLLFNLGETTYGLAAEAVEEIFLLPALTSIPESGPEVAGVLNLRSRLLPVLNLNLHLGHARRPNTVNQAVILVQHRGQQVGLIVDQIEAVEAIDSGSITATSETAYIANTVHPLTAGLAQYAENIVVLLNSESLVHGAAGIAQPSAALETVVQSCVNQFMAQFSLPDQQVLQRRAVGLAQLSTPEHTSELSALAVVSLEGEHFGLGLETVHEFANVARVTPVPCCPPHIVGNMNLRGEILTLVDVRRFLNLPTSAAATHRKAVVMRLGSLVAGVVVDDVFDVVYMNASDIATMPTTAHSSGNLYLKGITRYGDSMMSLVDLPTLLTHGELIVDQSG